MWCGVVWCVLGCVVWYKPKPEIKVCIQFRGVKCGGVRCGGVGVVWWVLCGVVDVVWCVVWCSVVFGVVGCVMWGVV